MTDPPMVGALALVVGRRYRVPVIVLSQDVFPEIAVELKRLANPVVDLAALRRSRLRAARADRVVAIGDTMSGRLEEKGVAAGAHARDPELGRHDPRSRRSRATTSGRASTA